MPKNFLVVVWILCISCNNRKTTEPTKFDTLRKNIIGAWGGLGEDGPVWQINSDSIYYFDRKKSYPYKLYNDSFLIFFPDHAALLHSVSIIQDTLIFYGSENIKTFAYRFKK